MAKCFEYLPGIAFLGVRESYTPYFPKGLSNNWNICNLKLPRVLFKMSGTPTNARYICKDLTPWHAHNAMHVTLDWTCQIISPQILAGMRTFNWSLCMALALCTPRLPNCFKMQTHLLYLCLVFPRIGLNIHSISACHLKWKKTNFCSNLWFMIF